MTAHAAARCDSCGASREPSQLYVPYGNVLRCKDEQACRRQSSYGFDPTLLFGQDAPVPRPSGAPGSTCAFCQAPSSVVELYLRTPGGSTWICQDRTACDQRMIEDMAPVGEDFADYTSTAAQMMRMAAAAPAVIPAERPAPTQDELDAEAWRTAMGRKRAS